jgi:hypothetical protein
MRVHIFVFLFCLISQFTWAGKMAIHIESMPIPRQTGIKRICLNAQTESFLSISFGAQITESGRFEAIQNRESTMGRTDRVNSVTAGIFKDWVEVHGYTTADKAQNLVRLDRELSPMRTTYISYETSAEDRVGIRIFDGSTRVLKSFEEWKRASQTDHRLPIERLDTDLILPERKNENSYLVELGLLDVTKNVSQGMRWAFSKVALYLDYHYNDGDYLNFGRTQISEKLGATVYAQTREEQVVLFGRFGLKPVLDAEGKPIRLKTGLILLSASAGEFVRLNYIHQHIPDLKGQEPFPEAMIREQMKYHHQDMQDLESKKVRIGSLAELQDVRGALIRVLQSAKTDMPYSEKHSMRLVLFLRTYFQVINSVPESWRGPHWRKVRRSILHSLQQADPQAAYLVFWINLQASLGNMPSSINGADMEKDFYQNMPIPRDLPFGVRDEGNILFEIHF